jgi:hypothetical protein
MKLEALTTTPSQLVAAIDKGMNDESLKTWKIVKDQNGNVYYTHTPPQWNEIALIAREVGKDRVVFTITHWSGKPVPTKDTEGYYFGRFTEILLVHFRNYCSQVITTVN